MESFHILLSIPNSRSFNFSFSSSSTSFSTSSLSYFSSSFITSSSLSSTSSLLSSPPKLSPTSFLVSHHQLVLHFECDSLAVIRRSILLSIGTNGNIDARPQTMDNARNLKKIVSLAKSSAKICLLF